MAGKNVRENGKNATFGSLSEAPMATAVNETLIFLAQNVGLEQTKPWVGHFCRSVEYSAVKSRRSAIFPESRRRSGKYAKFRLRFAL